MHRHTPQAQPTPVTAPHCAHKPNHDKAVPVHSRGKETVAVTLHLRAAGLSDLGMLALCAAAKCNRVFSAVDVRAADDRDTA